MPKTSKKLHDDNFEERCLKQKKMSMKSSNMSQKKTKNAHIYSNNLHTLKRTYMSTNKKLSDSKSSESVIYVGSYNMREEFPIIDLTNSLTSLTSDESSTLVPKYSHLTKYQTVHNCLRTCSKNQNLSCTASTSRLLGSLEGPKSYIKRNSKSATSVIANIDNKHAEILKTTDVLADLQSLTNKERLYINQMTQLQKEDYDIINSSLDIMEDINILGECNPQAIINTDDSVETLMKIYQVHGNDNFA